MTLSRIALSLLCIFYSSTSLAQTAPKREPAAPSNSSSGFFFNQKDFKIQREDYPVDGIAAGQGWDSFLGRKAPGSCVNSKISRITGHSLSFKFRQIDDKEHLFNSLNVSVSAKFNGGAYSGSGSVSFARSVTLDTSALNMLASTYVDKGGEYLSPSAQKSGNGQSEINFGEITLSKEALQLLGNGNEGGARAFQRMCGDSFVIAIREGGRLDALLRLQTYSQEQKQSLVVEFKAKGPSASGGASLNAEMQKKIERNQFEFDYNQLGGNADDTPTSAEKLISKLSTFGKAEGFVSKPYEIYTLSYKSLRNWPGSVAIASPQELDVWANLYWRYMNLVMSTQRLASIRRISSFSLRATKKTFLPIMMRCSE